MYNNIAVPMGMGLGAGMTLPFLDMSPLWIAMAVFALIACASAINRIIPRMVVEGQEWSPERRAAGVTEHGAPRQR